MDVNVKINKNMKKFNEFLCERVLNIGFNPKHEHHREKHRQEMHDLVRNSYAKIGGYNGVGSGTDAESNEIHYMLSTHHIKATKRNGRITALSGYRPQFGRKSVVAATDGTDQGKADLYKTWNDDHRLKRSWGEVSGASEKIKTRLGFPGVPNTKAAHLTKRPILSLDPDGVHYTRNIGGHPHVKAILGHPDEELHESKRNYHVLYHEKTGFPKQFQGHLEGGTEVAPDYTGTNPHEPFHALNRATEKGFRLPARIDFKKAKLVELGLHPKTGRAEHYLIRYPHPGGVTKQVPTGHIMMAVAPHLSPMQVDTAFPDRPRGNLDRMDMSKYKQVKK